MPTLVWLKPHRYNGRIWRKGQMCEASADDALVLTTLGVAAHATLAEKQQSVVEFLKATFVVEPEPEPVKRPRGRPRKNTYETRAVVEDDLQTIDLVADAPADTPEETPNDSRWDVRKPSEN